MTRWVPRTTTYAEEVLSRLEHTPDGCWLLCDQKSAVSS